MPGKRIIDDENLLKMLDAGMSQKEIANHFGVSCPSVCKKIKRLSPKKAKLPDSVEVLTDKEKSFVRLFQMFSPLL